MASSIRILQVTNIVSHHQLPVARSLAAMVGEQNFRFAALDPPDPTRLHLGWSNADIAPWILRAGEYEPDYFEFERWWDEADVVLCGERRFSRMANRLSHGQLCFYMSERWWKPPIGMARMLSPRFARMAGQFRQLAQNPAFHYLPIGPFASQDIEKLASFEARKWRWGYFTEPPFFIARSRAHVPPLKVLWIGRMLAWKQVDTLIRAVADAAKGGANITLTVIGDGPERSQLERLAEKLLNPFEYVFRKPISSEGVLKVMSEHDVYVLPSSAYEGWGAVINEAMSCGCAVSASKLAGAAAAMIEHNLNGLLFKPGDWRELSRQLKRLANDEMLRLRLGKAAHDTIENEWSPQHAAERFTSVIDALLCNRQIPSYKTGPMSRAEDASEVLTRCKDAYSLF